MPLGTKWQVVFETTEPIGDGFIKGMILDGVGTAWGEDRETPIAKNIIVKCLKEATEEEYRRVQEERDNFYKGKV